MPDRFSEVTDGLFRGGCPSLDEIPVLKDIWGIKKIVSLDEESGQKIADKVKSLGIEHIIWGLGDGTDPKVVVLKNEIVPQLLMGGPTYIHCYHGKDRTGMAVAMFRLLNGWNLADALSEAFKFGMGFGLSDSSRKSYYDAVRSFNKELTTDTNSAMDAVRLSRGDFANNPAINDMTAPTLTSYIGIAPNTDSEFSNLSRIASSKIYCKCKYSKLLRPSTKWWESKHLARENAMDHDGSLYEASISSEAKIEHINKKFSKNLMQDILAKDIDVAILRDGLHIIIYPDILVNIQEVDDSNDLIEVGMRDTSTDHTFAYPGSSTGMGGMPDGAAGVVQAPFGVGQSR